MDYHSHKMEEINKTIKELWVSTYVGAGKLTLANSLSLERS
jgi:hypothetical protein